MKRKILPLTYQRGRLLAVAGGAVLPALLLQYLLAVKPTAPHSWGVSGS